MMMEEGMDGNEFIDYDETGAEVDDAKFSRRSMLQDNDIIENLASKPLAFQWIDIDLTTGDPLSSFPSDKVVGLGEGPVPIIR